MRGRNDSGDDRCRSSADNVRFAHRSVPVRGSGEAQAHPIVAVVARQSDSNSLPARNVSVVILCACCAKRGGEEKQTRRGE